MASTGLLMEAAFRAPCPAVKSPDTVLRASARPQEEVNGKLGPRSAKTVVIAMGTDHAACSFHSYQVPLFRGRLGKQQGTRANSQVGSSGRSAYRLASIDLQRPQPISLRRGRGELKNHALIASEQIILLPPHWPARPIAGATLDFEGPLSGDEVGCEPRTTGLRNGQGTVLSRTCRLSRFTSSEKHWRTAERVITTLH